MVRLIWCGVDEIAGAGKVGLAESEKRFSTRTKRTAEVIKVIQKTAGITSQNIAVAKLRPLTALAMSIERAWIARP